MGDTFTAIWLPRIGARASLALRRSATVLLVAWPLMIAGALAASLLFYRGGLLGNCLGAACLLVAAGSLCAFTASRARVARELSAWYGVPIHWWGLPRFTESRYDEWVERRKLRPVAR
jgi:hypothetical protein